ncbi:MAG: bifunctional oligoribonuclease/PAP phosphatase NrnA [Desulfobacterales bacterium]|nr:bifunctional oligoribonuclease/PAP phosphatase NrnA [Desulfobacterales bacterium]
MDKIIQHLQQCGSILIATHVNPDGDAIGSSLAMGLAREALGKRVTFYTESPIPAVYRFLPETDRMVDEIGAKDEFQTAIILDCGDIYRVGDVASTIQQIPTIINIDHHITNTKFGNYSLIDTSACATAEIVYRLIKKMKAPIDNIIAISIYTGIMTDTGSFRFSNTNRDSFAICEEMVSLGVNPYLVAQHVYGTYSLGRIKLLNRAIDSIEISENGKLSVMTITKEMFDETSTNPDDVDGLINYAKRIEDVKVAALIFEQNRNNGGDDNQKTYHVSLRSDETVDVGAIATFFGGGGHTNAAGFSIESTLAGIKSKILNLASKL